MQGVERRANDRWKNTARQERRKILGASLSGRFIFRSSRVAEALRLSPSSVLSAKRKPPVSALARVPAPHAPSRWTDS